MTDMARSGFEPARWIDEERFRLSRTVFTDPKIFELEIERIFNRTWLYLGHESEIPAPGDYVTRPMGSDQVIVTRGDDGVIRAFLNACRHRGMQLCRADAGRAQLFVCPYHAWAYDTQGALRTTSYDDHYKHMDFKTLGLTPVAQLDVYRGLIFATWEAEAGSLDEHLGDLKWYLDLMFARTPGGMTVLGPPQRWVLETNWKIPPINFMDSQHALRTHKGPMMMAEASGAPPLSAMMQLSDTTPQVMFPEGHGIVLGPWSKAGLPEFFGHPPEVAPLFKEALTPEQLAQLSTAAPSVGSIFPNTSWVEALATVDAGKPPAFFLSLRNWQPLGPDKIEIWSWYFAAAEASAESRAEQYRLGVQTFGVGGVFEEDDAEVWACISRTIKGSIASRGFMDFSAGQGARPVADYASSGTAYPSTLTEQAQFGFMSRWNRQMTQGGGEA